MKTISIIEDKAVIKKILQHLGLWETRSHDPPICNNPHTPDAIFRLAKSNLLSLRA